MMHGKRLCQIFGPVTSAEWTAGGCCVGGGASGSMMLEDLMESIKFRGKPKVVDLTSQRKLADKASI